MHPTFVPRALAAACALALAAACAAGGQAAPGAEAPAVSAPGPSLPESARNRALLIVVDGLRPDYITPERMPNLHALGERGVFGEAHSAAFPTLTRVNSASISTGSYPVRHGITHNTMWVPEMGIFDTGAAASLLRLDSITGGNLLTARSAGEILEEHGRVLLVAGSGGGGNTLLQNHRGRGKGSWSAGDFFLPAAARAEAVRAVGPLPRERPAMTAWAVDAYLHHALGESPPDLTIMWLNETDAAGHAHGVGSPELLEALASVDRQIGRIVAAHEAAGLGDRVNIFVTADHGFTTNTGSYDISRTIAEAGLSGDDLVVVANTMIHVRGAGPERVAGIVRALQRDPQVGAVYTRPAAPGNRTGSAAGTVSTSVVQWDHPRSAEILVTPAWSDAVNRFGFPGATTRSGVATHGSDSPWDVRIRLVAAGPDLKRGVRSTVPTGNVDFAPTILHLLGIAPPRSMDGRVLHELLRGGPDPAGVRVDRHVAQERVTFPDGFRYEMWVETATVGSTTYLRGARVERSSR